MESEHKRELWSEAMDKLTPHVDGIIIAGYVNGGTARILRGFCKDDVSRDALRHPHKILKLWLEHRSDDSDDENNM